MDYEELLVNLCEPAVLNAVGRLLAGRDLRNLSITGSERKSIAERLLPLTGEQTIELLEAAARAACTQLVLRGNGAGEYFVKLAEASYPRIHSALWGGGLGGVFLSF